MALVSIIVPCYNVENHIEKTLASITSQSYQEIEIILVDDGNDTPLSALINASHAKDKRIRVVRHQINQGLSSSRNTGLKNANGEYVLFWDADDILYENTIQVLLALAIKNKSDVVRGVLARSDGDQIWVTKRGRKLLQNKPNTSFGNSPELTMDFTSCGVLFSKQFLADNNLAFEVDLYMQDILFTSYVLIHANKISMCDHIVGEYVQSPHSASSLRSAKRFQSLFDLYEKLQQLFDSMQVSNHQRNMILAGFINAGVNTFLLWKLEDYENNWSDLERLSDLLNKIGQEAINQYCLDMLDEPSYVRLTATSFKKYELAASATKLRSASNTELQNMYEDVSDFQFASNFLNQLREQRKISKVNSRLVLSSNSTNQTSLAKVMIKAVSKLKAKLN